MATVAITPDQDIVEAEIFIAAPPERVFDLWLDLDRMKEWVGGVTKVTDLTGPVDRAALAAR